MKKTSLQNRCLNYIVHDSNLTARAAQYLPSSLLANLMSCALGHTPVRDRALVPLLSHWPSETLTLSQLPFLDSSYVSLTYSRKSNAAKALIYALIEVITTRKSHNLRSLDLTGFVTDSIAVDLDLTISGHSNWLCLLRKNVPQSCRWLELKIRSFRFDGMSPAIEETFDLIKLQPQHTTAIEFSYWMFSEQAWPILGFFACLPNLVQLKIKEILGRGNDISHIHRIIIESPNLKDVELTGVRIDGRLGDIFDALRENLDRFSLVHCHLQVSDLIWISLSHQMRHLRYMNLSNNFSKTFWESESSVAALFSVLNKLRDTLRVIALQSCGFGSYPLLVYEMCTILSRYRYLESVDLSGNSIDDATLERVRQILNNVSVIVDHKT